MKFKNIILSIISGAALCSCSAVYEEDNLCSQGADVHLTFCKNMQGRDEYASQVHCAKLLLYDAQGAFYGEYEYNGSNSMTIDLPLGDYHAIAYGGMSCKDADVAFLNSISAPHNYTDVQTYLKGTRGVEINRDLHPHFHGMGDFSVKLEDMHYVPATIDLAKNKNRFRVELRYSNGAEINPDDFDFSVTADNAVCDHANKIVKQGDLVTYQPYLTDVEKKEGEAPVAWAEIAVANLTPDSEAHLTVAKKESDEEPPVDIDLIYYLEEIRNKELNGVSLSEYLERQDNWTLEFTLDPVTENVDGLVFKINKWEVVINNFDL